MKIKILRLKQFTQETPSQESPRPHNSNKLQSFLLVEIGIKVKIPLSALTFALESQTVTSAIGKIETNAERVEWRIEL